jgi:hypothetical protein
MLRIAFGHVKTLGLRNKLISKLYQHFRERGLPYGLQDTLPTLSPSCSQPLGYSATDPRLDTGGWLTLVKMPYDLFSRQGLSPCKMRRALPSAITSKLSGAALFAASLSNAMLGDFSEQTRKSSAALFFT